MGCYSSKESIDFDGPVDFRHFEILRAIGKGAFGKVCIVKKKDSKEMYAMKYMNKIQIIQKKAVDNMFREISILKSLDHPFLVNLWFAFQDEEDIFVVLDLMLGGDISYHLEKEGRFSVPRVQLYLAESCLALDYLREKNIIHRDIKPANMLLDSKGHIHLTDFNVACIVREGKAVTSMTGTKPYMAPEVIKCSSRGYSYAVDWWSLGVSAYEMLRGERPYVIHQNVSNEEIYSMLTRVRPPASARWDEATCNVLKVLLHPDPSKRLSTLEKAKGHSFFKDLDWDQVLNLETSPAYIPSQNRIHCDPTHELEEMIVEPNPLHKKKARLSKRHKDYEDTKLGDDLRKINVRFSLYNRIRENIKAVETEDDTHETVPGSPASASFERLGSREANTITALSLPRQESPYSTQISSKEIDADEIGVEDKVTEMEGSDRVEKSQEEQEMKVSPIHVDVEIHVSQQATSELNHSAEPITAATTEEASSQQLSDTNLTPKGDAPVITNANHKEEDEQIKGGSGVTNPLFNGSNKSDNAKDSGRLNGKETEDQIVENDVRAVNSETELIMEESRTIS